MSTYGAKAKLIDAGETRAAVPLPSPLDVAGAEADEDGRLKAARGIAGAIILSTPIWTLIAFVIYKFS